MNLRAKVVLLIGLLGLCCGSVRAGSISLSYAIGEVDVTCGVFGGTVQNGSSTSAGVTSADCDYTTTIPSDICFAGPCYGESVGSGKVYMETVPFADVMGGIQGGTTTVANESPAWFSGEASVSYQMAITETGTPPSGITGIPVTMTVGGSTEGAGALSYAVISGPGASGKYLPGTAPPFSLTVGSVYSIWTIAACTAEAGAPTCQAVSDPVFQFDQADFTGGFDLADYYSFEYSPNLTAAPAPVPEPSSLMLLGTGLLGLARAARRKRPDLFRPHADRERR